LEWKMLVYFLVLRNIWQPFAISYEHLVHFVVILHVFPRFGMFYRHKSGNPDREESLILSKGYGARSSIFNLKKNLSASLGGVKTENWRTPFIAESFLTSLQRTVLLKNWVEA
jgi:hypothetical protein